VTGALVTAIPCLAPPVPGLAPPILDFRVRLLPRTDPATVLSMLDSTGVSRALVSAGGVLGLTELAAQIHHGGGRPAAPDNAAVLAACAGTGGRLVPGWFADPHDDPGPYRERVGAFRALELSPAVHGVALADPRVTALVAIAASAGHPVYLVCLNRPGAGTDDLVELARAFPTVPFVFGHCGLFGIDTWSIERIAATANILVETSGCFTATLALALRRLGPDRVVFGTEYPLQHPTVELAKYAALDLTPAQWHAVAWRNAHRILGEELT
jgi:uncharacterized protein